MKFKLSQITVLVVSALSASAAISATINETVNVNNNTPGPVITGHNNSNDTIKYTGTVSNSPNTTTFVGRESATQSSVYYTNVTDGSGNVIGTRANYDYKYYYSPVEVDGLTITDSSVRINGKADNLTVNGDSVVTITGNDAYDQYQGANYQNPSDASSQYTPARHGFTNNRQDEVIISTGNGTYNDNSKQYLDGQHIGDVKPTTAMVQA
ncbi:hypothetical protein UA45_09245 [Morganella morganii]|uniref:Autotransporter outer membrane beta-barrel domain-containing protein n=1 Tax=Morganella morganii TaxID=582 RepID=A0A0D8L7P0_MORMO|nr:hypothetical protein UA45_09245 [Morganella morganii]